MRQMNRFSQRWMLLGVTALLAVALPLAAQTTGQNKAIDDYNFAAWLYNQAKYPLAADAYQSFLKENAGHAKAPEARFGLAQSLFYQDKFQEASDAYDALRRDHGDFPQMAEVLFQLAQCRVALNQFADAERLFGEVLKRFGDHYLADWAAARQAACLISLEKFAEAEELLKAFVERYAPGDERAADSKGTRAMLDKMGAAGASAKDAFLNLAERSEFYLGVAQFSREHYPEARATFDRLLKKYPQSALGEEARFRLAQALYQQKAYGEAASAYASAAAGTGSFAESAAFERGLALYKDGKLRDAADAFADMAERFPQSPKAAQAALYAGTFLYEAGDAAAAAAKLEPLAGSSTPEAAEAGYWLGMCLLKQGKPAEAAARFESLLKDAPKSPRAGDARLGLGDALLSQDKLTEAAAAFGQYAREFPDTAPAPRALYSACVALHRADKFADSEARCRDFLDRYGKDALAPEVVFLSGENRFLSEDPDRAAERYRELLERQDASKPNAARARFRLAWVKRQKHDAAGALKELETFSAEDAGEDIAAEVQYLKGVCLIESDRAKDAIAPLEAYLKAKDHVRYGDDALLKLASAHAKTGDAGKAIETYERFLKESPQSSLATQARYQLAETRYGQKQFDRAADDYDQVAAADPTGTLAPFAVFGGGLAQADRGQWDEALKRFRRIPADYADSELVPQARYHEGRGLMAQKQWADAAKVFGALVAKWPKHEVSRAAQVSLAYCLQEQKQWPDAAQAFRKAASDYPAGEDQARLHYEEAWAWREAGKESEALAAFQALVEKFPNDGLAADANFHLAEARYATATTNGMAGDAQRKALDAARALYEKVLAVPGDRRLADKSYYRIGWTLWLEEQYPAAAAAFDKLKDEYPKSDLMADALFQAGQAYAKAGQPDKAAERYRAVVEQGAFAAYTYRPEAWVGLAECLMTQGNNDAAIKALEAMTQKYPDHSAAAEANFLLGKAQFDARQFDRALDSFRAVIERTRGDVAARAQFYIGQVHQAKEVYAQALVAYLRVAAIYPQYKEWVAAATFESGKCQEALNAPAEARKAYEDVAANFKGTRWADMAGARLKEL